MFLRKDRSVQIGTGIDLVSQKKTRIEIQDYHRSSNMLICGMSGSGKSQLTRLLVLDDIKRGNSVVFLEACFDRKFHEKISAAALSHGRQNDLFLLSREMESKIPIDPLAQYFTPEEMTTHLMSGICPKELESNDYLASILYFVLRALVLLQKVRKEPFDIDTIRSYVRRVGNLNLLINRLETIDSSEASDLITILRNIQIFDEQDHPRAVAPLCHNLTLLEESINPAALESNEFIQRLCSGKGLILKMRTEFYLSRRYDTTISNTVLAMIITLFKQRLAEGRPFQKPLSLYLDSPRFAMSRGIEELLQKGPSINVWTHLTIHAISNLQEYAGADRTRNILENCGTQIYLRSNDLETATYVSDKSSDIFPRRSIVLSPNGVSRTKFESKPSISTQDFMRLNRQELFMFHKDRVLRGRVKHISNN